MGGYLTVQQPERDSHALDFLLRFLNVKMDRNFTDSSVCSGFVVLLLSGGFEARFFRQDQVPETDFNDLKSRFSHNVKTSQKNHHILKKRSSTF